MMKLRICKSQSLTFFVMVHRPDMIWCSSCLVQGLCIDQPLLNITDSVLLDSCVESRVFALIVAIDKYKNDQIPNLSGCENDGQNINAFLTKILHVPPSHIVFLTNEAATRHGIISNFETHLIQNTEIRKGDAMVFFYAGHGSRIAAPQRWLADSHLIETICPHDERTEDAEGNWIHGIPDRTIDGLMRKLAIHKGDNIVRPPSLSINLHPLTAVTPLLRRRY